MSVEEFKLSAEKACVPFEPPASKPKKKNTMRIGFLSAVAVLAFCFSFPLYILLRLAFGDDLYSYTPLIPPLCLYLVWTRRETLPRFFRPSPGVATLFFAGGMLTMVAYWLDSRADVLPTENYLAFNITAFWLFFAGISALFFGRAVMAALSFPMALLIFTVPIPVFLRHSIQTFLQNGSAACAGMFFELSGIPVLLDGVNVHLPGCILQVAPECSGIHSTLILVITGLIGSWMFLRSPWRRAILVLAVIPLALIRNGFRIFVIGKLCVAYGVQMLASPIHRHGGPLFFVLSLIPLYLLLLFLKKTERTNQVPSTRK